MSEPNSQDDEFRVDAPQPTQQEGLWRGEHSLAAHWDVAGDTSPCAVYSGGPSSMGRVTTPLGDLGVTNLFGSDVSMMRKLGGRAATDIREGALPHLNRFLVDVVQALVPRPMMGIGKWALKNWLLDRLRKAVPGPYRQALQAFAQASGRDVDEVFIGQLVWDGWALMMRAPSRRVVRATGRSRRYSPLLASASMVLPTSQGGPLHLRWLDHAAVDRWDRKASVAFFHPDQGLTYALVASAGYATGLPCGMNAAGLTLSVEPGRGREVNWEGTVLGPAAHEILRSAHTIDEAAALLRQRPSLTPWRYILCEGDTGRAAVLESGTTVDRFVDEGAGAFAQASGDAQLEPSKMARVTRWHQARRRALDEIVARWSPDGDDTVFKALEAMTPELVGNSAVVGHPLSGLGNVGAVVFEPAQRRLWVAAGRAPVSRRWFVPLTLRASGGSGRGILDDRVRPIKPGEDWENSISGQAMEHLRHAYQLESSGEHPQRILITVEHALALDPSEASLHLLAGLMALRAGRARRATGAFKKAIDLVEDDFRRAEAGVYLAWSLDLQKRRLPARDLYQRIAKEPRVEPDVRRWARRGRRHRFRQREARSLDIDFFSATAFKR